MGPDAEQYIRELEAERDELRAIVKALEAFLVCCAAAAELNLRDAKEDPAALAAHGVLTHLLTEYLYPGPDPRT